MSTFDTLKAGLDEVAGRLRAENLTRAAAAVEELSQAFQERLETSHRLAFDRAVEAARIDVQVQGWASVRRLQIAGAGLMGVVVLYLWQAFVRSTRLFGELAGAGDTAGKSFIAEWAGGFSGQLSAALSLPVVGSIVIILGFVALLLWLLGSARSRQVQLEADLRASALNQKLSSLLGHAEAQREAERQRELENSEGRALALLQGIHDFVERFEAHSAAMERVIQAEQERLSRLASDQSAEAENLRYFSADMKEYTRLMVESGRQFAETFFAFKDSIVKLSEETNRLFIIQSDLIEALKGTEENVRVFRAVATRLGQVQATSASDLLKAATQDLHKSTELVESVDALAVIVRQVGESQLNLQNALDDQMRSNDSWLKSVQNLVDRLEALSNTLEK